MPRRSRFQLYNPAHQSELLKLFEGVTRLKLQNALRIPKREEHQNDISNEDEENQNTDQYKYLENSKVYYENSKGEILVLYKSALFTQVS